MTLGKHDRSGGIEFNTPMIPSQSQAEPRCRPLLLLLCIGACLLPIAKAQTNQPPLSQDLPIWSDKPRQVGYDPSMFRKFRPMVGGDRVRIQFLDDQRLALSWLTPDKIEGKLIGPLSNVPSHLHLTILDAHTGQQISSHEWSCSSAGVNLAYTASGQWLLSSNQTVTLYSSSFDKARDLQNVKTGRLYTLVSPGGRTFLSYLANSHGTSSAQLRDSATFEVLDSWNDARFAEAYIAYSDHFILAQVAKPRTPQQLYLRKIGGDWSPYSVSVHGPKSAKLLSFRFVNDNTIGWFPVPGKELTLETIEGAHLFSSPVPEFGLYFASWPTSATATRGERFAVILDRLRGLSIETLDMYPFASEDRVIVYSVPQRGAVFSVRVKGTSPWPAFSPSHFVWNRIALSPDGQLLGIASDEGVRVYALPSLSSRANVAASRSLQR